MEQKRYWFRAKRYGWGWTPATWEGWTVLIVWMVFFVSIMTNFVPRLTTEPELLPRFFFSIFVATMILLIISYKTGEPLGWHWGDK